MVKNSNVALSEAWFKPLRHSYIPINYIGALTYVPYVAYLLFSLYEPLKYLHPQALALLVVIPNWLAASAILTKLAKYKSR